jgi:hypothetical protein
MVPFLDGWLEFVVASLLSGTVYVVLRRLGWLDAVAAWVSRRRRRPEPTHRPIEELAGRARVLSARYHHPAAGTRHAKVEGIRLAYDAVLSDLCDSLSVAHLLGVLPPGSELDSERRRVEQRLELAGLDLGMPLV